MIKYIIFSLCLILAFSHNVTVKPEIGCALTPSGPIEKGAPSNVVQKSGWAYSCSNHSCQEVTLPEQVNVTTNFFTSLELCNSNCSSNEFFYLCNIFI